MNIPEQETTPNYGTYFPVIWYTGMV